MATSRNASSKHPQTRSKVRPSRPTEDGGGSLPGIPPQYQTAAFIGLILLSLLVFFGGVVFSNKLFTASDFLSWESFRPYLNMMDQKGESPLWIPYIFSGMPGFAAYLVTGDRWWDLTMKIFYSSEHVFGFINYPVMRVVMHYFIYGTGMYLLMRSKKAERSTSLFVSLAAMFSTWIIIYVMIGHNTKIMTLMTFPFIFLCLEKLIDRWSLLYAGLLILAVHILWESSHLQTAFYGACAIGFYMLFELVAAIITKDKVMGVVRAALVIVVAGGFTYGMGMDRNLAVQEYVPYSTRGAGPIKAPVENADKVTEDGGHGYTYATEYSFSPAEMFTYLVPGYYGFGKIEYRGPATGNEPQQLMTYWGQMTFTDAAHYMGIAVFILALFGAWRSRKERFVQALMVIGVFGLLLSFGGNLPFLFDLFYNMVPGFNKFRAPSQSLVLLEFVFPLLAGFGIESLIALRRSGSNPGVEKKLMYGVGGFGVFGAIGLLAGSVLKNGYMQDLVKSGKPIAEYGAEIQEFVFNTMQRDWMLAGFFGVATLLLMYFYVKGQLKPRIFTLALFSILLIDLWRIDYRPMETQSADLVAQTFAPTDIDQFLDTDSTQYRILDVRKQTAPNYPAHQLHEHIIGYHAAKLRNYQNLLDVAGNGQIPTSPLAWDILNTKYFIAEGKVSEGMTEVFASKQQQAYVFRNETALPRAWFVNRVEVAEDLAVLEKIKDQAFDPREVAFVKQPLTQPIEPVGYKSGTQPVLPTRDSNGVALPDTVATAQHSMGGGTVAITKHEALHIAMDVEAPGQNFLVVSEVHYPPAWHATIDGKPAEIIQTNYLLRGLIVPPGKHTIEMNYVSEGFETGRWVSLGLNLAMFAIIGVGIVLQRKEPKTEPDVAKTETVS